MPDVPYTFHIPYPDEGKYGMVQVISKTDSVETHEFGKDRELIKSDCFSFMEWEEAIRERGIVITPLIQRLGVAVSIQSESGSHVLGCLIPSADSTQLLDSNSCIYRALVNADMDVVELFFMDVLVHHIIPVGEILYLNMAVLEDENFRAQGAGGKVLFTRLNVPNVRSPEPGKLYVTCLLQPRSARGRSTRSATAITFAVNPWDVQTAAAYVGPPGNVVKHLQ